MCVCVFQWSNGDATDAPATVRPLLGLIATVLWEIRAGEDRDDYEGNCLL